ncbi:MAG: hypothetical protein WC562_02540 [Dehalococcoidia bacterium]
MSEEQKSAIVQNNNELPLKTIIAATMMLVYGANATATVLYGHVFFLSLDIFPTILILVFSLLFVLRKTSSMWWGCVVSLAINVFQTLFYAVISWWGWWDWDRIGIATVFSLWLILALFLLLSNMKQYFKYADKTRGAKPVEWTRRRYLAPVAIVIGVFLLGAVGLTFIWYVNSRDEGCGGCRAYNTVSDELKNAVAQYASDRNGSLPILSGTYINADCLNCPVINISALLTANGGLLAEVPQSCNLSTSGNDNCRGDTNLGCSNEGSYIWIADTYGNVFSYCAGAECTTNNSGYQDVWP